jgi:Na+/H+ antiporter NhaD/arsenite permease-like protein
MSILALIIFILGYLAIAFENSLRLNKAASALITGVFCWLIYFIHVPLAEDASKSLLAHFGDISSILFFLLGAMTIVTLIDSHGGFDIITNKIKTKNKSTLLVIISLLTFFLSALLDNLTTAIVMASISSKLLQEKEDRRWFAGMIIIAANAGGVWSPLGDVTTTMLWIGGQITALTVTLKTILPSMAVWLAPLAVLTWRFRGKQISGPAITDTNPLYSGKPDKLKSAASREGNIMLVSGIILLLFVPVFKILTHTPPFMGMLLALSFMWIITSFLRFKNRDGSEKKFITPSEALQKIDSPSILFFLGILLAVSAMDSFGLLKQFALLLSSNLKNDYLVGGLLGMLSAVVDNVPLVAATQGMYDLLHYPTDHFFWEFINLTTGVGGSIIIIGSAAGVAVMGIEKISFMWYLKKISWLAALGFIAGVLVFILQQSVF